MFYVGSAKQFAGMIQIRGLPNYLKNNPNKSHINILISDTTEFVEESNMNNALKCLKGNLLIKHLLLLVLNQKFTFLLTLQRTYTYKF